MNKNDYRKAIDCFLLSTHLEKPNSLGFLLNDYWDYIPNIELSVCYYKLGNKYCKIRRRLKKDVIF